MSELDDFKKIDLRSYAASCGYGPDKSKSSKTSFVFRHPDGDKIVIGVAEKSGDWVYWSMRAKGDKGTIIDFLKNRGGGSIKEIRQTLRDWKGDSAPRFDFGPPPLPMSRDRGAVLAEWERAKPCAGLSYLTGRGLGPDLLALPIFQDRVRVDQRGNAIFPHYDNLGLCGFEIKNQGFTGFSAGGSKGLWYSAFAGEVKKLILCESAIDALSFHLLNAPEAARYMSTGGALNPQQPALLQGAMEKLGAGAVVVLAFDHDDGGEKLSAEVRAVAPASVELRRMLPPVGYGKDWNEYLKLSRGLSLVEGAPRPEALPDPSPYGARLPPVPGCGVGRLRPSKRFR